MPDLADTQLAFPARSIVDAEAAGVITSTTQGTVLTAGSPAHTKPTTFTELIASTAKASIGFIFHSGRESTAGRGLVDIATGPSGSETVLVANIPVGTLGGSATTVEREIFVLIRIAAGTRISARWQSVTASATLQVSLTLLEDVEAPTGFPQPAVFPVFTAMNVETAGAVTADSSGTSINAGATLNTKGTWVELIASTAKRTIFLVVMFTQSSSSTADFFVDIGTGPPTEVVLIPNIHIRPGGLTDAFGIGFPIRIPAGTRIAARCQSATSSVTVELVLLLCQEEA